MFDQFQKQASKNFKEPFELPANTAQLLNWAIGLSGETGEVSEVIKHHVFGKEPLDKMALAKELGDVLWYLAAICTTADISLSAVADLNIQKLEHRYGGKGYSKECSANRHESEKAFKDTFIYKRIEAAILKTPAPLNVIFVGPDGSGKTSISKIVADKLAEEGFTYHKCDYRQEDKPNLARELLSSPGHVFDRFYYPDDIIYSRIVWEREHPEEPMQWDTDYWKSYNAVVDDMCNYNTLVIYVDASDEVLKERSKAWADDYVKVEELAKIRGLYQRWMGYISSLPIILCDIDTSEVSIDEAAETCYKYVKKAQAAFSGITQEEENEEPCKSD